MLDLFTCSYKEMRAPMGVPVRFTVGAPRFALQYPLSHVFRGGTPTRAMLHLPKPAYREAYFALLDGRGVTDLAGELLKIAEVEGQSRLVLLCFEDLGKPSLWCHRTLFGEWWKDRTGDEVRELGRHDDDGMHQPESVQETLL